MCKKLASLHVYIILLKALTGAVCMTYSYTYVWFSCNYTGIVRTAIMYMYMYVQMYTHEVVEIESQVPCVPHTVASPSMQFIFTFLSI